MVPHQPPPAVPVPRGKESTGLDRDLIVVAVDGSEASIRALVWALRRGTELGLRVEALTAWPLHGSVFVREVAGHFCEPRWRAREVQADAVSRALAQIEDAPPYDLRVVNADFVDALGRAGARAALVVVGSDALGRASSGAGRAIERIRRSLLGALVVVGPNGQPWLSPRDARRPLTGQSPPR